MATASNNFTRYLTETAGVTEEQVLQLASALAYRTIRKGEFLLHEGDVCKHSFFTEQGLLRSYTIDDTGKEHIIQFAPENWFISDRSSMYFNEPSYFFI